MPFGGTIPITTAPFRAAGTVSSAVMPAAIRKLKRSRDRRAMRQPAMSRAAKAPITIATPTSPSSSASTESTKSVCASGQVVELLATVAQPDAEEAAARERDERLHELEALVVGVRPRIAEGEDAVRDVGPELDRDGERRAQQRARHREDAQRRAGDEEQDRDESEQHDGAAGVGLDEDQAGGNRGERQRAERRRRRAPRDLLAPGEHRHDRDQRRPSARTRSAGTGSRGPAA